MRILVTGGAGVIGNGTVTELVRRGHTVVLLSRNAARDSREWSTGVVARNGDVSDPASIRGAAANCDLVLHLVGIVQEEAPDLTFEKVNVSGTRNMLAEAAASDVKRFIYASSLNAQHGKSAYHESKRKAESLVREFKGKWTIARPGNVYGPGDNQISMMLRIVRGASLVVPTVGEGDQPFQPIWWEDVARAFAEICERTDLARTELDFSGTEVTSQNDLLRRMSKVTGRDIHGISVPVSVASLGARMVSLVGWDLPLSDDQIQMLEEGNVIGADTTNALVGLLGVTPTSLDDGLGRLGALQPEQLPEAGIGSLQRKRFWADIDGCAHSPEALFALFRSRFNAMTPVFVGVGEEPNSSSELEMGESLTLTLPMRGHVQVRVQELTDHSVTLLTLIGHPIAGAIRFLTEQRGTLVRFQVEVYERAANFIDFVAMRSIGDLLQNHTWTHTVENVVSASHGTSTGVEQAVESLDEKEANLISEWLEDIMMKRKRDENTARMQVAKP